MKFSHFCRPYKLHILLYLYVGRSVATNTLQHPLSNPLDFFAFDLRVLYSHVLYCNVH